MGQDRKRRREAREDERGEMPRNISAMMDSDLRKLHLESGVLGVKGVADMQTLKSRLINKKR